MNIKYCHIKHKGHPIATVGVTNLNGCYYAVSAICHRLDQFSYEVARRIIQGRFSKFYQQGDKFGTIVGSIDDRTNLQEVLRAIALDIQFTHFPSKNFEHSNKKYEDILNQLSKLERAFANRTS